MRRRVKERTGWIGPVLALALFTGCRSHEHMLGTAGASAQTATSTWRTVPFVTSLHHWDHHWFTWLPRHPLYESLEVMSTEPPNGAKPLVWAFFTERAGAKHQVHYLNDEQVAAHWGGDTYFRAIEYSTSGDTTTPLGVHVAFQDKDKQQVSWDLSFPPGTALRPAGLTDQSGHAATKFFLIFFRERSAVTTQSRVLVGARDLSYSPGPDASYPFPPAYSANVFTATFPFTSTRCDKNDAGFTCGSWGSFTRDAASNVIKTRAKGASETIELHLDGSNRLAHYEHVVDHHMLNVDFDPPIPNPDEPNAEGASHYTISLDGCSALFRAE